MIGLLAILAIAQQRPCAELFEPRFELDPILAPTPEAAAPLDDVIALTLRFRINELEADLADTSSQSERWERLAGKYRQAAIISASNTKIRDQRIEVLQGDLLDCDRSRTRLEGDIAKKPAPERVEITPPWLWWGVGGGIVGATVGAVGGERAAGELGAGAGAALGAAGGALIAAAIPLAFDAVVGVFE